MFCGPLIHSRDDPELVRHLPELQSTGLCFASHSTSAPFPSSNNSAPDFPKLRRIRPTSSPPSPIAGDPAPLDADLRHPLSPSTTAAVSRHLPSSSDLKPRV